MNGPAATRPLGRRSAAHGAVAGVLARGGDDPDAVERALELIAEAFNWDQAALWERDEAAGRLRRLGTGIAAAPCDGDADMPGADAQAELAWRSGRGVRSRWEASGSALAVPVRGPGGALGALALLAATARPDDPDELDALERIGHVLGSLLVHRRATTRQAELIHRESASRRRAADAERAVRFIVEAGSRLSASLDVEAAISATTRLAVPDLGEFCALDLIEPGGGLRRGAVAHRSERLERAARQAAARVDAGTSASVRRALATGAPVLVPEGELLASAGTHDASDGGLLAGLDVDAAVVAPLRSPAGPLGTLTLAGRRSSRSIGMDDVVLAQALADRAGQAVAHARLLEAERAARAGAEKRASDLAEAQQQLLETLEHAPAAVALLSLDPGDLGRWLRVNPALCELLGRTPDELLSQTLLDCTHPEDRDAVREGLHALLGGAIGELRHEQRLLHAAEHSVWVQIRAGAVRGPDGRARRGVAQIQDITDRKIYERQLEHLADHDALTGIFNRRRFEQELDRAVAHARRFDETAAALVVDLDNFKYVNDTYGHAVGDELLGRVAGALKARLRSTDVLGRLGGDEFAAILPRVSRDEARTAAVHMLSAVRADGHVLVGERKVRATCSIGINTIDPGTELTAEELLVEADLAMFEAKEAGRDRVAAVEPGEASRAKMKARMTWSERIRDALEHDHFELWEQPILTVASGSVDRVELLVRMLDVNGDAIPPGVFLYIAERFGQIQAVDRWVIARAIRLLAERGRIVEVNLSGASITDAATIDFIASEIRNAPIDPTQLVFEVTETTAIVNVDRARRFARRLSDLGCQFALDDFGSGFGSFYYLKHLPFDCVKIDGDFIKELPVSRTDQLTVQAIVQIARGLGKETVAEFVQDERTVELLRSYGVDYAQGYHIGRPRRATKGRRPSPPGVRV